MSEQTKQELLAAARARMERQGRRGLRRRAPRPRRPEQAIREYRARLRELAKAMEEEVRAQVFPELESIIEQAGTRADAVRHDDWGQRLRDLFNATRMSVEPVIGRTRSFMLSLGDRVEGRATQEQINAVRAVLGVAPTFYDDGRIRGILNAWKEQNGAFITRMADEAVEQMMDTASRAVRAGRPLAEVREELRKRFGINERRAKTVARTEVSQLNAQITRERQREVGIPGYYWTTAGDERVRDDHEDMAGEFVPWDKPPSETGRQHAGEPINCRCSARAAVDRLLDELESN